MSEEYRKQATKEWCSECMYYKTEKCEDWSICDSSICEIGYMEWLENKLKELEK